jgi:hypothetical protein
MLRFWFQFLLLPGALAAQKIDSVLATGGITGDSIYIITENRLAKNRFFGNSWYVGFSYNLTESNEYTLNAGRTFGTSFCGGGGCYFTMKSWGLGFALRQEDKITNHVGSAFAEFALFPLPPAAMRADYLYDITLEKHYLRPSLGFSFLGIDLLYNYTFLLSAGENDYRHGALIRIKYFLNNKNWQKSYPRRC